ncbi:MAG: response regulator [Verrucomicrobia bacterium]|nr:response regulator [Verrucomicrobiota bacterium]
MQAHNPQSSVAPTPPQPRRTWQHWLLRTKLYLLAIAVTLAYFFIGHLNSTDRIWAQINLPLSAASVLLVCLSAVESYLLIHRFRQHNQEMAAARARELELQQHLAYQRQTILSQLTSSLMDRLDTSQIPQDVLEKICQLFESNLAAIWTVQTGDAPQFLLRGVHGLNAHTPDQLQAAPWSLPEFDDPQKPPQQQIATSPSRQLSPALAAFTERERVSTAVLTPIIRRHEHIGLVGIFYREPINVSPALAAEMNVLANLIASAVQAEELYRDLVQAQKSESIGNLTSGIAHDFNNVLAAILACATYVKQHTPVSDPNYRYLEATENSAHRGAALTKQLLAFARRETPRQCVLNPNDGIQEILQLLERSFDKSILFQRSFVPNPFLIEIDPSQFEQIVLNMAVNARDAMPNGGIFTVSTNNITFTPKTPRPPGMSLTDGDYLVLGFSDTGHGMDEATQRRIFEPFYTTKRPGKGTGLGLSLVMSIVKAANGAIHVESAVGKGTHFEVYLHATNKPLPSAERPLETKPRRGTECILLAEDEDIIREMAQITLEAEGYKVIAAPDGAAALSRYRHDWPRIALVIADMVMPHMSGTELLAKIKEINPDVRIIVSSGHSHDLEGQRMLHHGCLAYLQKPYSPNALITLVRQVLDSGL